MRWNDELINFTHSNFILIFKFHSKPKSLRGNKKNITSSSASATDSNYDSDSAYITFVYVRKAVCVATEVV